MHLRRLIVLIINARNINDPFRSCTDGTSIIGLMFLYPTHCCIGLIGQIKKTRIHVQSLFLPEGVGSNRQCCISLRCPNIRPWMPRGFNMTKLCSYLSHACTWLKSAGNHCPDPLQTPFEHSSHGLLTSNRSTGAICPAGRIEVVEPDGIEPTTSCLQSRRSPS